MATNPTGLENNTFFRFLARKQMKYEEIPRQAYSTWSLSASPSNIVIIPPVSGEGGLDPCREGIERYWKTASYLHFYHWHSLAWEAIYDFNRSWTQKPSQLVLKKSRVEAQASWHRTSNIQLWNLQQGQDKTTRTGWTQRHEGSLIWTIDMIHSSRQLGQSGGKGYPNLENLLWWKIQTCET